MGRFSQLKRNTGWGGVIRSAVVLGVVTVVPTSLWAATGDWRGMPIAFVPLALPVFARKTLVRNIERTESALRYGGYALVASAFVFPFVQDSLPESAGVWVGAAVFAALSLYISVFVVALSDPRIEVRNDIWQ